ncbi:Fungalysin metallopeptidase domain-containing protein [Trichoderma evansii]
MLEQRRNRAVSMLFIPKLIIASLAVQSVAGFSSSSQSDDEAPLIRELQAAPSRFRIYDPPVDVSHFVGVQQRDNVGAEHKIPLALAYLKYKHGIQAENVRITASVTNEDTGVSYVYARQTVDRVDMLDGVANINIDKHGRVMSSSQTFAPIHQVRKIMRSGHGRLTARSSQYDSLKRALKALSKRVQSEINDEELSRVHISEVESEKTQTPKFIIGGIPTNTAVDGIATAQESMMRRPDGSLAHVWDFMLEQTDYSWNARISIPTGGVESLVDRRSRSGNYAPRYRVATDEVDNPKSAKSSTSKNLQRRLSYLAIPITRQNPGDGVDFIVNPESAASPNGWVTTNTTAGNNAIAFKGTQAGVVSETSPGTFAYDLDERDPPSAPQNVGAAIVNAFYVVNSIHDISYIYGFTEATFNFQEDNFGRGGLGNDRITISIQDSTDINEVDFATSADGQSGGLRLSIFNLTNPYRDSGLENDLIAHACAVGIANRLTGGGTAACLQSSISRGLAVGWADAFADWLEQTDSISDFTLGAYVTDNPQGIRSHPYSRSPAVNPLTYEDGPPSAEVHHIGEVWANMLHNVLAALSDSDGWSDSFLTDSTGTLGNVVFMHLFMDGLSIQPCEPTFITARDAFIQADQNRYGGSHYCVIWRVFANKGLGFGAAEDNVNEYSVPPGC